MRYAVIPVTHLEQNCTLAWCEITREAVLVDPGGDAELLLAAAAERDLAVTRLLLTHGHIDHVGAAAELAARLGVAVEGPHQADDYWLRALPEQCAMFGFPPTPPLLPDRWLGHRDVVTFGEQRLEVLHCPGHTPGHVVFFHRGAKLAIVGDVLFAGSIGRTDFPGGSLPQLLASIRERLWPLGDEVTFIPGHGPASTFGRERRMNPFVRNGAAG